NVDAARWFCREVWPAVLNQVPDARFWLAGARPSREVRLLERLPGVEVFGSVPDVRPYLSAASVAVVPIRSGSGTRLKVLEAMAAGKAVVSTDMGVEGLEVDGAVRRANGAPEMEQAVIELLRDRTARRALAARAAEVVRGYDWQKITPRFAVLLAATMRESLQARTA
ncbi:MAG: glycosyltransferase, partial [Chloroflexota bacterium]